MINWTTITNRLDYENQRYVFLLKTEEGNTMAPRINLLATYVLFATCCAMFSHSTLAGNYELAKYIPTGIHSDKNPVFEKNMELCKAYEANLNSFHKIEGPFACERPLNPKFKEFSKPEWKSLNPIEHLDLLVKLESLNVHTSYANRNKTRAEINTWEKSIREAIKFQIDQGRIRLKVAKLDLVSANSDAPLSSRVNDNVLRVERGDRECKSVKESREGRIDYFIANESLTDVRAFRLLPARADAFLFRGAVYFDAMAIQRTVDPDYDDLSKPAQVLKVDRYEIYVLEPYRDGAGRICRYRYVD